MTLIEDLEDKKRILAICDNPTLTTGFANVARPILNAFVDHGWNVLCLGIMGGEIDLENRLKFPVTPCKNISGGPSMGMDMVYQYVTNFWPDAIWIIVDPGSLYNYLYRHECLLSILEDLKEEKFAHLPKAKPFRIVAYTPIEGQPISRFQLEAIKKIDELGAIVFYTEGAAKGVQKQWPEAPIRFVHHGYDHAPFEPYPTNLRAKLKEVVGWDDKFLVGVFGANKRTKGFGEMLRVVRIIDGLDPDERIQFYFHTEPLTVMDGPPLLDKAKYEGVDHRIIFKPDPNLENSGNPWQGVDAYHRTKDGIEVLELPLPDIFLKDCKFVNGVNASLLGSYDYISRLNMLDLLVDPSQVEGWGLIPWEAMKCKVPVLGVRDYWVRDELSGGLRHTIEPVKKDLWDIWQTGADLVKFDPEKMAQAIMSLASNEQLLHTYVEKAYKEANSYTWANAAQKMIEVMEEVL